MTETGMWIYPVAFVAAISIIRQVKLGLYWTWGMCLQQVIIFMLAIFGLTTGPDWLFAILAWLGFGVFSIGQRRILLALNTDLGRLYMESARKRVRILRLLLWGPPGQFWQDMVDLTGFYASGDAAAAQALGQSVAQRKLPVQARETLADFIVVGKMLVRDWPGLVSDLGNWQQSAQNQAVPPTLMLYQAASRAYLELGRPQDSVQCLEEADFTNSRYTVGQLDAHFMSIFALAGAWQNLESVLARLARGNQMPEYARLFWQGRCLQIQAQYEQASQYYRQSMDKLPAAAASWRDRILVMLNVIANEQAEGKPSAAMAPDLVSRAQAVLNKSLAVARIIHPDHPRRFTRAFSFILIVAFFLRLSAGEFWNGGPTSGVDASMQILYQGVLESSLVLQKGEWWRLFSYQFLHANLNHLAVNVLAMWWFGAMVEGMYGPLKTAIITLGAGALAGLAQIILTPDVPAIGASGAIMGVFGAAFAGMYALKSIVPSRVRQAEMRWMGTLALVQIIFDQVINHMPGSDETGAVHVAAVAHAGGMLAGAMLGFILRPSGASRQK